MFQEIKKRTAGAAVPEDMEWCYYAEIYETIEPQPAEPAPAELKFSDRKLAGHFDPATAGVASFDFDGDARPDLIAWSAEGVHVRSEEHTSELQSLAYLVCRLLLEKKKMSK